MGEQGSRRVTLEEVGRRIGVTKSAIYHYFPSKAEMIRAMMFREARRLLECLEQAAERAADPAEKLRAILRARAAFLAREGGPGTWSLETAVEIRPMVQEVVAVLRGAEQDLCASILGQGAACGQLAVEKPEAAAKMLVSCIYGFDEGSLLVHSPRSRKDLLDALLHMVLEGFLARGARMETGDRRSGTKARRGV
jgi:AcrR family transcriptional regulator